MNQTILNSVNLLAEELLLHYASPNKDMISEIMQLDGGQLSSLSTQQLSAYAFVLGQYVVMLQNRENMSIIEHKLATKTYEYHLNKTKFSRDDVSGKTAKERDAWVLLNVPEVKQLYDKVLELEAKKMIVDGMVRAVEGLLNALKKEVSVRQVD